VLAFQGVQGLMGAMKEAGMIGDGFHVAVVDLFVAAAQKSNPLMFDRDANGELIADPRMIAMLLGESHEAIVAQIKDQGIDSKEVIAPKPH
jgi:hypothetical protein